MRSLIPFACLALTACSKLVIVDANEPARVEVGGFAVCDRTPCEVKIYCKDSFKKQSYTIRAIALASNASDERTVDPCQRIDGDKPRIQFNLRAPAAGR